MKKILFTIITTALFASSITYAEEFRLFSKNIREGKQLTNAQVFNGFGCNGKNKAPKFTWSGTPENTKSFAITAYDPDAPTGSGWWHWITINIPADTTKIGKEIPFEATEIANDFGSKGYGGACPPPGEMHRYIFTLHALNTEQIDVPESVTSAYVRFLINAHEIGKASITAVYTR